MPMRGWPRTQECDNCLHDYRATSPRSMYCPDCALVMKRRRRRGYYVKNEQYKHNKRALKVQREIRALYLTYKAHF